MLFILVMDVLTALVNVAEANHLLRQLASRNLGHRISIYADDVVIITTPDSRDLTTLQRLLQVFAEATGLRANMNKSSLVPIRCAPEQVDNVRQIIPCDVATFPIKYLGLPLSVRKLTKADLQCYVDKIADMLPGWKVGLLARAGRLVLVRAVLSAVPVYMMIAMEIPKWVIKAIEKILQGFLWHGRKDTRGGHCLIAWGRVARPLQLGGLGVHNLQTLNWALRMRWLWLQRTDPDKPWAAFNIQVHDCAKALFTMSVKTEVGDGSTTLFWTHRWIAGKSVEEIAPSLLRHVKKKRNGPEQCSKLWRRMHGYEIYMVPSHLQQSGSTASCGMESIVYN